MQYIDYHDARIFSGDRISPNIDYAKIEHRLWMYLLEKFNIPRNFDKSYENFSELLHGYYKYQNDAFLIMNDWSNSWRNLFHELASKVGPCNKNDRVAIRLGCLMSRGVGGSIPSSHSLAGHIMKSLKKMYELKIDEKEANRIIYCDSDFYTKLENENYD